MMHHISRIARRLTDPLTRHAMSSLPSRASKRAAHQIAFPLSIATSTPAGTAATTAAVTIAIAVTSSVVFPNLNSAKCASDQFATSDALYADGNFVAEAELLGAAADKKCVDWIWRSARSKYQIASLKSTPASEKQVLIEEAYEMIQAASALDETTQGVLLWHGIILSEWSALQGTKVKIAHLLDVKRIWEKAVELHPNDTSALHFLGRWEFGITEIDWFSRNAANLIFGSLPPASYESALAYFSKAEEINPGFWKRNLVFVAQCEIALGRKDEARKSLLRAQQISNKTEEDLESSEIIKKILKKQGW